MNIKHNTRTILWSIPSSYGSRDLTWFLFPLMMTRETLHQIINIFWEDMVLLGIIKHQKYRMNRWNGKTWRRQALFSKKSRNPFSDVSTLWIGCRNSQCKGWMTFSHDFSVFTVKSEKISFLVPPPQVVMESGWERQKKPSPLFISSTFLHILSAERRKGQREWRSCF